MNRQLVYTAAAMLLLASCKSTPSDSRKGNGSGYADVPSVEKGWDVFTGSAYRYGPSIILNDDGSIDVWYAAPGGQYGEYTDLFDPAANKTAVSLGTSGTAAQRFTADEAFFGIAAQCPSWGSATASLTLSLYRWNTDYTATVSGTPVATQRFDNYGDNAWLMLSDEGMFPAGEYLWVLDRGNAPETGVWKYEGTASGTVSYFNREPISGSYAAHIARKKTSGGLYWDQASYQHSEDGGRTWSQEKMVLKPTEGSRDALSVCDPGVARWGGYYYIGYTSTENTAGLDNHVYVCRSASPEGPWEKWNGNGWGGDPQPMIEYTGDPTKFGAGEPSMVVLNDTVYFYYTWNDSGNQSTTTRLATAPAGDPNWPGKLTHHGTVINKSDLHSADHCDVKYRDDLKKFQALHTVNRMTAQSGIMLWESEDGIRFERVGLLTGELCPYLHNCGWSGDAQGHIDPSVAQFVAYAYGSATAPWGEWKTRWSPLNY